MPDRRLAEKLIAARTHRDRMRLASKVSAVLAPDVALQIKAVCFDSWTSDPAVARRAAAALRILSKTHEIEPVPALADWVAGIAAITSGKLDDAVTYLDSAFARFSKSGAVIDAANTQVAKLIPLALLGKYDAAIATAAGALRTFVDAGDHRSAGKVEKNLGNIVSRFGRESEAEKYYRAARNRFALIGDVPELAMADNSLGNTYAELNDFVNAEKFYRSALEAARASSMTVTEAEIEASMGRLALFRGRFDEALRLLEVSRQKYDRLAMPHQKAIAELEIADTYLELNMVEEARKIYHRAARTLKRLKLRGEEARARLNLGKTALGSLDLRTARTELERAAGLFGAENDPNGVASAKLTIAEVELKRADALAAGRELRGAERALKRSENVRFGTLAMILRGDAYQVAGKRRDAERVYANALDLALANEQQSLAVRCLQSLGEIASNPKAASKYFNRAVGMIESLRAPLPAEEFRMAFLADKLAPYVSLARIEIGSGNFATAFRIIEDARARTLFESLFRKPIGDPDPAADSLRQKLATAREELNWFYSRAERTDSAAKLNVEIRKREKRIATLQRQIGSTQKQDAAAVPVLEISELSERLGPDRALIEYLEFDGRIGAFVVTGEDVRFVADLTTPAAVVTELEGLRFQFGALRYGADRLGPFLETLKSRADHYLERLYDLLIAPLLKAIGDRDLIVVPTGPLNYVPFQALRGERYLVEEREVVNAPSASVWLHLSQRRDRRPENALLIGVADERIPLVESEIDEVAARLPGSVKLTGSSANFGAFAAVSSDFDIIHLACHGRFRPDNPLFSSLTLADGQVTVRDLCESRIRASVVTLSACETGLSAVAAGEEILGLSRGFLSAGAGNLVLSLWTVNDSATANLMAEFYQHIASGATAAAALQSSQLTAVGEGRHPYFWAPFIAIGK